MAKKIVTIGDEIISEVASLAHLKIEELDLTKPINTLGIDSIAGVELLSALEDKYGVVINPEAFFQGLTVQDIIDKASVSEDQKSAPKVKEIRFSVGQKGLWMFHQMTQVPIYNEPCIITIKGLFEMKDFKEALETVMSKHELLRASVATKDGQPIFIISDHVSPPSKCCRSKNSIGLS